jgi:lysophospholipase L1-like esterase
MKLNLFLISLTATGTAFAQPSPAIIPMPSSDCMAAAALNTATYPAPSMSWMIRVNKANENAHKIADSIQLVFDGDSITDGWQGAGKAVWEERYGNLHPINFGISGDRTQNLLWRLSQGQMDGIRPKLIVLMIGTNNSGRPIKEVADGVKAIVDDYQKHCPEAVILLQAIFPRGEQPGNSARVWVNEVNQILSKLGDEKNVIYIDFGDKFLNSDGTMSKEVMPDFLHPSAKGYQIWADAIQPVIDKYFPSKLSDAN